MKVQGRRKRGRPKRRWLDKVKDDIKEKGLSADDVYDRATWRRMSSYIDPTQAVTVVVHVVQFSPFSWLRHVSRLRRVSIACCQRIQAMVADDHT